MENSIHITKTFPSPRRPNPPTRLSLMTDLESHFILDGPESAPWRPDVRDDAFCNSAIAAAAAIQSHNDDSAAHSSGLEIARRWLCFAFTGFFSISFTYRASSRSRAPTMASRNCFSLCVIILFNVACPSPFKLLTNGSTTDACNCLTTASVFT